MDDILNEPIQIDNPATNSEAVRIALIVDESGSMTGCAADTIKNLNGYIDEQAMSDEPVMISVYTFNSSTGVRDRFTSVNAKEAPHLSLLARDVPSHLIYAPDATTPLHDAIASVIVKETSDTPTLVVILTDGMENASREYRTNESIRELINKKEAEGWTFVFLMAGLSRVDSVNIASNLMGRDYVGATMTYSKGLEDAAFVGLAASSAGWATTAREIKTSGGPIVAETMSNNFFDEGMRDIKKKKDNTSNNT
jgi:uncharacterized protein YegL